MRRKSRTRCRTCSTCSSPQHRQQLKLARSLTYAPPTPWVPAPNILTRTPTGYTRLQRLEERMLAAQERREALQGEKRERQAAIFAKPAKPRSRSPARGVGGGGRYGGGSATDWNANLRSTVHKTVSSGVAGAVFRAGSSPKRAVGSGRGF